jgi:hypothetical protein
MLDAGGDFAAPDSAEDIRIATQILAFIERIPTISGPGTALFVAIIPLSVSGPSLLVSIVALTVSGAGLPIIVAVTWATVRLS